MPDSFSVETLRINLSRQQGNAAYAPRTIELTSRGGLLTQGGASKRFPYSGEQAVALLNAFYAIHFFALPDHYATHPVATLTEDGLVVLAKQTSSSASNSVCVATGRFEKCVRYGNQAPVELERLVTRIYDDAERLASRH